MLKIRYQINPFFPLYAGKGANPQTGNFSGVSLEKGANFSNHVFFNKSIIYGRILGCVKGGSLEGIPFEPYLFTINRKIEIKNISFL